jgi:flavin reductase (DIM6/NTAB) family NADH-FMN oxidoreductase RutF
MVASSPATHPASFSSEQYKAIFRSHPAGVAIVTLSDGDRPVGFTATSVISVSAEPPVIAFSVVGTSSCWPALSKAEYVVIHFLDESHHDLANRFATSGIDRFQDVEWERLSTSEPLLTGVPTWTRCRIISRERAGASYLLQVQPETAAVGAQRIPIVYHDRAFRKLGMYVQQS